MIRKAQKKDIDRIMELLLQVNNVHAEGRPDLFIGNVRKYTAEEVCAIISDSATPVYVSTDSSDRVQGYCFCRIEDHAGEHHLQPVKTLYIDDLCVDSSCRGQHIGTLLYRHVKDLAKEGGFHNLTLNVWACNPGAMRFYESLGLQVQKTTLERVFRNEE